MAQEQDCPDGRQWCGVTPVPLWCSTISVSCRSEWNDCQVKYIMCFDKKQDTMFHKTKGTKTRKRMIFLPKRTGGRRPLRKRFRKRKKQLLTKCFQFRCFSFTNGAAECAMIKPRKKQADVLFVKLSAGYQRRAAILSPLIFPQKPGSLLPGFCVAAKRPSRFQFSGKLLQLDAEEGLLVKLRRVVPQPAHRFHPVADGVGMLVQRPGGLVHISAAPDEGGQRV